MAHRRTALGSADYEHIERAETDIGRALRAARSVPRLIKSGDCLGAYEALAATHEKIGSFSSDLQAAGRLGEDPEYEEATTEVASEAADAESLFEKKCMIHRPLSGLRRRSRR